MPSLDTSAAQPAAGRRTSSRRGLNAITDPEAKIAALTELMVNGDSRKAMRHLAKIQPPSERIRMTTRVLDAVGQHFAAEIGELRRAV